MHKRRRDHQVIELKAENKVTDANYLAGIDRVVAEMTEEKEREDRVIAERQRRLGVLSNKINDIKRKRRAAEDDLEMGRGVKALLVKVVPAPNSVTQVGYTS